jgi:uncharacterized protein (DUF2147 family)
MKKLLLTAATAAVLVSGSVFAQETSPIGLWKTIDDETGKPKALVRVSENGGEFTGKIEKLFRAPDEEQNPKCTECEGSRKDQPIIGMTVLWNLRQEGDEYTGGQILDPANGKIYKSKMSLSGDGKELNVRGYFGVPMLGRTQTWIREN